MANDDFFNGVLIGYALAFGEVRNEIDAAKRDVDRMLVEHEAKIRRALAEREAETRRTLAAFAERHGLPFEDDPPPRRTIM